MSIEYVPGNSILHRMHPITKLVFLLSMFIMVQLFLDLISLGVTLLFVVFWWLVGRLPAKRVLKYGYFFLSVFAIFLLAQGFFYWRGITPMFYLGDFLGSPGDMLLPYTYEGFFVGLGLCLRILTVVSLVPIFSMTTATNKLLVATTKMKLPFAIGFAFVSAMRFVPLVERTFSEITDSQRIRALDFESLGFWARIKAYIPITIPMVLGLVRKSDDLEIAIESRAFGAPVERTYVETVNFGSADMIFLIVAFSYIGFAIYNWLFGGTLLPSWLTDPVFGVIDPFVAPILALGHSILFQLGTIVQGLTYPIISQINAVLALSPLGGFTIPVVFLVSIGIVVLYVAVRVLKDRR